MRPRKPQTTGEGDLFRARLDQIINMKHELVQLAGAIDWEWLDTEVAPLFSDTGRPASPTRFMIGLLLLKHIFALSDEQVCERWVYDPYFQYFTGAEFFQHALPHERSEPIGLRPQLPGQKARAIGGFLVNFVRKFRYFCIRVVQVFGRKLSLARSRHQVNRLARPLAAL